METITAQEVIRAVEQITSQTHAPLKVDYYEITPDVGEYMSVNTVQAQA
jgi:hypothetical protein